MVLLNIITEAVSRGWENFTARPEGPMKFRFILQPLAAIYLAVRAGIRDAKSGSPAYLWAIIKTGGTKELIQRGWKEIKLPFLVSACLDIIYQVIVHKFIYPFELLFTAIFLVVIPYLVIRGPINRVVRMFVNKKK